MKNLIVKPRIRKLKVFWGKSKSQIPSSPGRMVTTIVLASSRQKALKYLLELGINVTRRAFFAWPEEDYKHYSFLENEGVWQSEINYPKSASEYIKINQQKATDNNKSENKTEVA